MMRVVHTVPRIIGHTLLMPTLCRSTSFSGVISRRASCGTACHYAVLSIHHAQRICIWRASTLCRAHFVQHDVPRVWHLASRPRGRHPPLVQQFVRTSHSNTGAASRASAAISRRARRANQRQMSQAMGELRADARKAWDKLSAETRGSHTARVGLAWLDPIFQRLENIAVDNEEWPGAADVWRRNADIFNMLLLMLSDATEVARTTNAQAANIQHAMVDLEDAEVERALHRIQRLMSRVGCTPDSGTCASLISLHVARGDLASAMRQLEIFSQPQTTRAPTVESHKRCNQRSTAPMPASQSVPVHAPRLRHYAPVLHALCEQGERATAMRLWDEMGKFELLDSKSEMEHAAMLRLSGLTGDEQLRSNIMHSLRACVVQPVPETVAAISVAFGQHDWGQKLGGPASEVSNHTSRDNCDASGNTAGDENASTKRSAEYTTHARAKVLPNGQCSVCGTLLRPLGVTLTERSAMRKSLFNAVQQQMEQRLGPHAKARKASKAAVRFHSEALSRFEGWLFTKDSRRPWHRAFDYILDCPNVAFAKQLSQRAERDPHARFRYEQIDLMLEHLRELHAVEAAQKCMNASDTGRGIETFSSDRPRFLLMMPTKYLPHTIMRNYGTHNKYGFPLHDVANVTKGGSRKNNYQTPKAWGRDPPLLPGQMALIERWLADDTIDIYCTPRGAYDDWYWALASLVVDCPPAARTRLRQGAITERDIAEHDALSEMQNPVRVLTNDLMRDHAAHMCFPQRQFDRWKRTQTMQFEFSHGFGFAVNGSLAPPSLKTTPASNVGREIQFHGHNCWHVPVAPDAAGRDWLCTSGIEIRAQ